MILASVMCKEVGKLKVHEYKSSDDKKLLIKMTLSLNYTSGNLPGKVFNQSGFEAISQEISREKTREKFYSGDCPETWLCCIMYTTTLITQYLSICRNATLIRAVPFNVLWGMGLHHVNFRWGW